MLKHTFVIGETTKKFGLHHTVISQLFMKETAELQLLKYRVSHLFICLFGGYSTFLSAVKAVGGR